MKNEERRRLQNEEDACEFARKISHLILLIKLYDDFAADRGDKGWKGVKGEKGYKGETGKVWSWKLLLCCPLKTVLALYWYIVSGDAEFYIKVMTFDSDTMLIT